MRLPASDGKNPVEFFSPGTEAAILRDRLIEGKAVSDLCDKHQIHLTVFYQWRRQYFENETAAFELLNGG